MNIVLINPPHTAIGSRVPDDHLPPLGLLALGGPLIDAGHKVRLVDAEFGPMPLETLVRDALSGQPDCILIGHSGSTSAHPTALAIARMVKALEPATLVIYGGVFPTYHWRGDALVHANGPPRGSTRSGVFWPATAASRMVRRWLSSGALRRIPMRNPWSSCARRASRPKRLSRSLPAPDRLAAIHRYVPYAY